MQKLVQQERPTTSNGTPTQIFERAELEKIFDAQLETLVERGYPEAAGMTEDRFRELVGAGRDNLPTELEVVQGSTPVLIVIPSRMVSISKQLAIWGTETDEEIEFNSDILGVLRTKDDITTPKFEPYLLFNVEPGATNQGKNTQSAERSFVSTNRRGLTLVECIALSTHSPQTSIGKRGLNCAGSRVDSSIPTISQDEDGILGRRASIEPDSSFGTPSCNNR